MRTVFSILLASLALCSSPSSAEGLVLEHGTMALGGKIAFPFEVDYRGETKWKFEFEPTFDYFVSQNFSLGGGVHFTTTPIDSAATQKGPLVWGFHGGFKYYQRFTDSIVGFTGFGLNLTQNDMALVSVRWGFEVPIGLLVSLNENIALVFNVPVRVACRSTTFFNKLIINPGYFGVSAFF